MHCHCFKSAHTQNQKLFYVTADRSSLKKATSQNPQPSNTQVYAKLCEVSSAGPEQFNIKTKEQTLTSYP